MLNKNKIEELSLQIQIERKIAKKPMRPTNVKFNFSRCYVNNIFYS